ncbi:hypothetical protein NQ317_008720 [Molorchus minor]|uniref:Uncharacterized protein n=1 Tax=Molorchus minor TaxID=1323400 RepID=A0ABQ9IVT4_9CUCU|nr:hypothetical protein NQ317_008720 [Molorchus minor]
MKALQFRERTITFYYLKEDKINIDIDTHRIRETYRLQQIRVSQMVSEIVRDKETVKLGQSSKFCANGVAQELAFWVLINDPDFVSVTKLIHLKRKQYYYITLPLSKNIAFITERRISYYTYDGLALTAVPTTQYQMQIVAYTSLNLNNSRYKILALTIGPSVDTA